MIKDDAEKLIQEFDAWEKWELFTRTDGIFLWARVGASEFRVTTANKGLYQGRSFEIAAKVFLAPYKYLPVQTVGCYTCKAPLAEKLSLRSPLFESLGLWQDPVPPGPCYRATYLRCSSCGETTSISCFNDTDLILKVS